MFITHIREQRDKLLLWAMPLLTLTFFLVVAPNALAQSGGGSGGGSGGNLPFSGHKRPNTDSAITQPMWNIFGIVLFVAAVACLIIGALGMPKLASAVGSESAAQTGARDRAMWQTGLGFGFGLLLFAGSVFAFFNGIANDILS
jgi:hypothetical protein